jgi:hypothetical protein
MRLHGTLLAADQASRILRYRLLPFGEPGYTNVGKVTAGPGCLQLCAAEDFVLNLQHEKHRPLGIGVELAESPAGLDVAVRILATTAGDDLLVEAAEGVRTGVSVEVDGPVVRAGRLVGGRVSGGGAVVDPAFASARLVASELPDAPDDGTTSPDNQPDTSGDTPAVSPPLTSDDDEDDPDTTDTPEEDMEPDDQGQTAAPVATAPRLAASRKRQPDKPLTFMQAMHAIVRLKAGDHSDLARLESANTLFAAFGDATTSVTSADVDAASQPQWLGEVWSPAEYTRRIIPLITSAPLTSLRLEGFRWVEKPTVAKYPGAIAEINSTPVSLAPVNEAAQRWAGGNRLDRAIFDFPDAGVLASYLRMLNLSYAQETDEDCLAVLLAEAAPVTPGGVPSGQAPGWAALVDAALALVDYGTPSFAVVAKDLWRDMAFTTQDDALSFLTQSLGLTEGAFAGFRIVPHPNIPAGQLMAGIKAASTHYELPGSPLRVNAQAIAVGSVDEAVFGYDGTIVHDARGLALVTTAPVIPFAHDDQADADEGRKKG